MAGTKINCTKGGGALAPRRGIGGGKRPGVWLGHMSSAPLWEQKPPPCLVAPAQAPGRGGPAPAAPWARFWNDTPWPNLQAFISWHKRPTQKVVKPGRESTFSFPPSLLGHFGKFDQWQENLKEFLLWQREVIIGRNMLP